MFRRNFFHTIAGALAYWFCKKGEEPTVKRYAAPDGIYDWNAHDRDLPYGIEHYRMRLDGRELNMEGIYVLRCKIGKGGWIEEHVHHTFTDPQGKIQCRPVFEGWEDGMRMKIRAWYGEVELWIDGVKQ